MNKLVFLTPLMVIGLYGCGNRNLSHAPIPKKISSSKQSVIVKNMSVFSTKPILPKAGIEHVPGIWDVRNLPSSFGAINPVSKSTRWQPMNFGQDKPVFAENVASKLYMGTDAGVWYRNGQRWTYMPGTEKFSPIVAITVTPAGAPIIATQSQILAYVSRQWIRISNKHQGGIRFLRWTKNGEMAAGVTNYPQTDNSSSVGTGPAPIPVPGVMLFDGKKWSESKSPNDSRNLIDYSRPKSSPSIQVAGIHYIGLSPAGTPTVEMVTNSMTREIWQESQGEWKELNTSGFPADKPSIGGYFVTQDVTWWNDKLVVSSPSDGALEWTGSNWETVGNNQGMTSHYHRTGSVMSTMVNILFAEVKETVPAPPKTPRRSFNTLWEFTESNWKQLRFPKTASQDTFGDPVLSKNGDVAVSDTGPWSGNHVWLYQNQKWHEVANGTGIFKNAHVERMKFAPNGHLTVELVGGPSATPVNIYEWTGNTWTPVFPSNHVVSAHLTYWFDYTWAPDGSIVIGLMNGQGYSIWRYKNGEWTDLGLYGQRPAFLYVTKQNTLFVVTDKYVCWRTDLKE